MRVRREELAERVVPDERPPHLPPAEEHALLAGETVDDGNRLSGERALVRVEPQEDSAEVADVLPHREPADDVEARELSEVERLVLRAELRRLRFEPRRIFGRPPVAEHAVSVGLPSLIVETGMLRDW